MGRKQPPCLPHHTRYTEGVSKEMERKNSLGTAEEPHPIAGGFFAPGHCSSANFADARLMAGRATDTTPARGRSPPGCTQVLNLPAAYCCA